MALFGKKNGKSEKHSEPSKASKRASSLPHFCYDLAYFVLPQFLFNDPERTIGYFVHPQLPGGPFLYLMGAKVMEVEPAREHSLLFETHTGTLTDNLTYYVLQYPTPPPVDLNSLDAVLAPFFSAILHDAQNGKVDYFTLGQNPLDGTTLRCVLPDRANCNLGPGPVPELNNFLETLRQRRKG